MANLTVNVGVRGLGQFQRQIGQMQADAQKNLKAFQRQQLSQAKGPIQQATWKHTGRTAAAWKVVDKGARDMALENDSPLILYQFGTRPHNIPNAFGWGRRFGIGGRFGGFFHPGNQPNKALISAMDKQSKRIRAAFGEFWSRVAITYGRSTGGDA